VSTGCPGSCAGGGGASARRRPAAVFRGWMLACGQAPVVWVVLAARRFVMARLLLRVGVSDGGGLRWAPGRSACRGRLAGACPLRAAAPGRACRVWLCLPRPRAAPPCLTACRLLRMELVVIGRRLAVPAAPRRLPYSVPRRVPCVLCPRARRLPCPRRACRAPEPGACRTPCPRAPACAAPGRVCHPVSAAPPCLAACWLSLGGAGRVRSASGRVCRTPCPARAALRARRLRCSRYPPAAPGVCGAPATRLPRSGVWRAPAFPRSGVWRVPAPRCLLRLVLGVCRAPAPLRLVCRVGCAVGGLFVGCGVCGGGVGAGCGLWGCGGGGVLGGWCGVGVAGEGQVGAKVGWLR